MHQFHLNVLRAQNEARKTRIGLNMGAEPWKHAVPFVKLMARELQAASKHVTQMEAGAADGLRRAQRDFG